MPSRGSEKVRCIENFIVWRFVIGGFNGIVGIGALHTPRIGIVLPSSYRVHTFHYCESPLKETERVLICSCHRETTL